MNTLNPSGWAHRQDRNRHLFGNTLVIVLLGTVMGGTQFSAPSLAQAIAQTPNTPKSKLSDSSDQPFETPDPKARSTQAVQLKPPVVPPVPTIPQQAFEKNQQSVKISLDEAIQTAIDRNPNLNVSRWEIEERKGQQQQAKAGLYPTVSLRVIGSYADSANANAINSQIPQSRNNLTNAQVESALTVPGSNGQPTFSQSQANLLSPFIVNASNGILDAFDITLGTSVTGTGNINLNWYFFTSGRVQSNIRAASQNVEASKFGYEQTRQELIYQVITAYNNIQRAYGSVKISQAAVKSAESLLNDNREKLKVGLATPLDVLQAETQLATATQDLIAAQNTLVVKQVELSKVLSLEGPQPLEPSDRVTEMGDWDLSVEDTIVKAFNQRPEPKQQLALEQAAKAAQAAAFASTAPQLSVFTNLQGLTGDKTNGTFGGYNTGIQIQWDAFDGGLAAGQANSAQAKAYQARARFAATINQIRYDVQSGILSLNSAKQRIAATKAAVASATEAQRKVQLYFSQGYATTTEVILNEQQLIQAQVNYLNAVIDYNQSLADIKKAVGILTP